MRRIQAPGVEINEIDRSQYNVNTDDNLTDTAVLVTGFADNGPDYETVYISNINQFIQTYGYPTNEEERYFYYAAKEVIDNRGVLYCCKLPYSNGAFKKITYVDYKVGTTLNNVSTLTDIVNRNLIDYSDKSVDYVNSIPGFNSFSKTMRLDLLALSSDNSIIKYDDWIPTSRQLRDIDEYYNGELKYDYLNDFMTYMFDIVGQKQHIKPTYDTYLRHYSGLYYLSNMMSEQISNVLSTSDLAKEYGLQNDFDVLDDLSNIVSSFVVFFNSKNYSSPIEEAYDCYLKTISIDKYEDYYKKFNDEFKTLIDKNVIHGQPATPVHYWKQAFSNLSDYCNELCNVFSTKYTELNTIDDTITSYVELSSDPNAQKSTGMMSLDDFDNFKIGKYKAANNTIRIFDITRGKYRYNDDHDKEFLGVMPVITTAANALYYQDFIKEKTRYSDYNVISRIRTTSLSNDIHTDLSSDEYYDENGRSFLFATPLSSNSYKSGVADIAVSKFPSLTYTASQHIDRNYLKQIGIVVFKLIKSATYNNKVLCTPVESFVGSLNRSDTDNIRGTNVFIDNIVNDQSQYINVFTNVQFDDTNKKNAVDRASTYIISNQTATSLGFFECMYYKNIHVKDSICDALDLIFKNNNNIDRRSIDIVCDAGVSNIAQYIASVKMLGESNVYNRSGEYDLVDCDGRAKYAITSDKHTTVWRHVLSKYDAFCKLTRKDCMFIADGMRQTCLIGNEKIVRKTKPTNTIMNDIIPQLKYQLNLNTSYGAGYCDWFYMYDDYSGLYFWCPPSIKAAGIYVYSDIYYNYWDAPAGLNRGIVKNVYDIAFNPTLDEAGHIYKNSWNYAMQYPLDGIVLEGQRTFQINHTAFDRVNVRRLFLKMEKLVYRMAKTYCYEGNTAYLRQRFVDSITPIFEEAKIGGGISEYIIICNDKNNTIQTIENHELHCTIAVRPIKTIEFVVLNFIALPQSGSFSEEEILKMTPYYSSNGR